MKALNKMIEICNLADRLVKREWNYSKIKPAEALFFLTYRCSSRCQMCAMWKRKYDYEEMDLSGWKKAVDMLAEQDIGTIYLFGGDVLLRKKVLVPLATYIAEKGIDCDITTNGYLLKEDIAKKLIETGAKNIGVSIDAVGDLHNRIRGVNGMFERASHGVRHLVDARGCANKPSISIYCTVSKLNIDAFDKVLPHALDLGVDEMHFEPYGEFTPEYACNSKVNGIAANPYFMKQDNKSLLLDKDQASFLKGRIVTLKEEARGKIHLDTDNIERVNVRELSTGIYNSKRCYLSRYHIVIDPSGNVLPCLCFQDYHLGNVQENHLRDIWGNHKHTDFLSSLARQELKICEQCVMGVQRNRTAGQKLFHEIKDCSGSIKKEVFHGNYAK
jgi:Fe-coproporphyrin III synthase